MAHSRSQMSGGTQILDVLSKLLNRVLRISLHQYLGAELYPKGIVLSSRSIKSKNADELACSAIAWGVSTSIFKKGAYMSVLIHNDAL